MKLNIFFLNCTVVIPFSCRPCISATSKQNSFSHSRLCKTPCAESILINIWQNEEPFWCVSWNEPVNLPTHSFCLKLEQPILLFLWLERAGWGWCPGGSLEPGVFSSGGGCWIGCVSHVQQEKFCGREHQKTWSFASWFISQSVLLEASVTHWIKRKLPTAQLRFCPVCSWSHSNKLGF